VLYHQISGIDLSIGRFDEFGEKRSLTVGTYQATDLSAGTCSSTPAVRVNSQQSRLVGGAVHACQQLLCRNAQIPLVPGDQPAQNV